MKNDLKAELSEWELLEEELSEGEIIEQTFFDWYYYDQEGELEAWDGVDL